jgi:hypothetical protein
MRIFRSSAAGRHRIVDQQPAGSDIRDQQPAPQPYNGPWPPAPAAPVDVVSYGHVTRDPGIPAPVIPQPLGYTVMPGEQPPRPLTGLPLDDALYVLQEIHSLSWSALDPDVVAAAIRDRVTRWYDRHVR